MINHVYEEADCLYDLIIIGKLINEPVSIRKIIEKLCMNTAYENNQLYKIINGIQLIYP